MKSNIKSPKKVKDKAEFETDALLKSFKGKSPKQVSKWIRQNATDQDSIVIILEAFGAAIGYLVNSQE